MIFTPDMTKFTPDMTDIIDKSVLCWLATADDKGQPNVSPKQIFCAYNTSHILVANIASPRTVRNIKQNSHVSISMIDIFKQKGYNFKGEANILNSNNDIYAALHRLLKPLAGNLKIISIINIKVSSAQAIAAPSYTFDPDTTEEIQIEQAMVDYNVRPR